jgi:hypothetical protein
MRGKDDNFPRRKQLNLMFRKGVPISHIFPLRTLSEWPDGGADDGDGPTAE